MTVSIGLLDDGAIETEETFTIALFNPQPAGVVVGTKVFTVTIVDNDLRKSFTLNSPVEHFIKQQKYKCWYTYATRKV